MIHFSKPATYNHVKLIEARVGNSLEPTRLLLKCWPGYGPNRWEVWTPRRSHTMLHRETVSQETRQLARDLTLQEAKAFAVEYIEKDQTRVQQSTSGTFHR